MRVGVLGELRVDLDGHAVAVPKGHAQRLLMALAVDHPREVVDEVLVDRLWGQTPTQSAMYALRNNVAKLRRLLGADAIVRTARGYSLATDVVLDLADLESAVSQATSLSIADADTALQVAAGARTLRRGPAFAPVRNEWWARHRAAAADDYADAADDLWADLVLRLGPTPADIVELTSLARSRPERESRWTRAIRALSDTGRGVEALRAAHEARAALAEVGMTPGRELTEAERAIVDAPSSRLVWTPGTRLLEASRVTPIVGREQFLQRLTSLRHVTWVLGSRGQGKSRVMAELAARARSAGSAVLYLPCRTVDGPTDLDEMFRPEFSALGLDASASLLDQLLELTRSGPVALIVDDVEQLTDAQRARLTPLVNLTATDVRFIFTTTDAGFDGVQRWWMTIDDRHRRAPEDLAPLTNTDLEHLILAAIGPRWGLEATRVQQVAELAHGHPAMALEFARGLIGEEDHPGRVGPPSIVHLLARLTDGDRQALAVVVAAATPLSSDVLAGVTNRVDATQEVRSLEREGFVVRAADGRVSLAPRWTTDQIEKALERTAVAEARQRLIQFLGSAEGRQSEYARQLVDARRHGLDVAVHLDAEIGPILDDLLLQDRTDDALDLASIYLDAVGFGDGSTSSVTAHLSCARVMLDAENTDRGVELLDFCIRRAVASGDADLIADAIIARGPFDMGAADSALSIEHAEQTLSQLAIDDVRRCEVSFVAAHHHAASGDRQQAMRHLDAVAVMAEADPARHAQHLTFVAEAALLVDGDLDVARDAWLRLCAMADTDRIETAEIGAAIIGTALAMRLDGVAALRTAAARLQAIRPHRHHVPNRWLAASVHAGVALAVDDLGIAGDLITRAEQLGNEQHAAASDRMANVQRMLFMYQMGSLGMLAPLLADPATAAEAPDAIIGTWGIACRAGGDRDGVRTAAARLAARPNSILSAGPAWPLLAMAVAEIADAAADRTLAGHVIDAITHWSGTGLDVGGAAYLGTADRALGLARRTLGDHVAAVRLFDAAIAQEHSRGTLGWAERTRRDLRATS